MAQGTQVCHCEAPTGPWQSHAGSCDFADGFPVVRPCSARLPRRFAPRNDTSGAFTIITIGCSDRQHCAGAGCPLPYNGVCGRRQYAQICCCQRRSLTAATDAIGFYVFNGSLYELQVPAVFRLRILPPVRQRMRNRQNYGKFLCFFIMACYNESAE